MRSPHGWVLAVLGMCTPLLALQGCDPAGLRCRQGEEVVAGQCVLVSHVRLNSVGFLPDRAKRATVAGKADGFTVRRPDQSVAFTGSAAGPVLNLDTGEDLFTADFSSFTETGEFYLDVPGAGESPRFRIAADVYREALQTAMLGLYGQRCGTAVSFVHAGYTYSHGACHGKDAYLDFVGGSGVKQSLSGWHDAGDYGKYTVNGAFSVAFLLKAWEHFEPALRGVSLDIPEHGGPIPDWLAETRWELDWLLTTQLDDGRVSHKVTAQNFEGLRTMPQADTQRRYLAPPGTAAAAAFTAVMAMAARIYAPHDAPFASTCLGAAQLSYAYLTAHPAGEAPDLTDFHTGAYTTPDDDDRLWAAAEMWETTGDPNALADFESRAAGQGVLLEWDWSNLQNLGLFTYVLSKRPGRNPPQVASIEASVIDVADRIVQNAAAHGYGRGVGSKYYWGIHGTVARTGMALWVAHRLAADDRYLDAAAAQLDHLFGRNYYGRSQVTGLGHLPPRLPHHRPSVADQNPLPWPGLVVGGPWPDAKSWVDAEDEYETNEVAINWSAALIYDLAAFVP